MSLFLNLLKHESLVNLFFFIYYFSKTKNWLRLYICKGKNRGEIRKAYNTRWGRGRNDKWKQFELRGNKKRRQLEEEYWRRLLLLLQEMAKNLSSLVHELRERIAASSSTPTSRSQNDDALVSRFRDVLPNLLHSYVVPSSSGTLSFFLSFIFL